MKRGERGEVRAAAAGVCEEAGEEEDRGREESREKKQERGAAAGGGGGAAGGYDGHACVVPRHRLKRCFIKDEVQTRMSAEPESKRQKTEPRDNIVVVSNMGDKRPEEIVPDTVATFCLNHGFSVTSYVCVPGCVRPMFLANYTDDTEKRYVKKMVPSTTFLVGISCDVMFLLCHGIGRSELRKQTDHMRLHEEHGVGVSSGDKYDVAPNGTKIWSCSEYKDGDKTYTKPEDAVTLSDVVHDSGLVFLLCCHGADIVEEYMQEKDGRSKPALVVFYQEDAIHDISINVFLALLMTSLDTNREHIEPWDAFIRRHIGQIFLWVNTHGRAAWRQSAANRFWEFLLQQKCVEKVPSDKDSMYRIKGCINAYSLADGDMELLLSELQSVHLLLWESGAYASKHAGSDVHDILALMRAPPAPASGVVRQGADVDALLLQLQGLLRAGDAGSGI